MSGLIEHLRSFNRKERFILLREVLGSDLDWLQMALYLAATPSPPERISNDQLVSGNQEDADLLVAFDGDSTTHVVLIEAKVETNWTNRQLNSKAGRLSRIFGEGRPGVHLATPHYVLASPEPPPPGISATEWPEWMKPRGEPVWMELERPAGLKKPTRCTARGRTSHRGRFVRIDSLSGGDQPEAPGAGPYETLHNGQTYTVDAEGFVLLASGRRDKRYKYPLGEHP